MHKLDVTPAVGSTLDVKPTSLAATLTTPRPQNPPHATGSTGTLADRIGLGQQDGVLIECTAMALAQRLGRSQRTVAQELNRLTAGTMGTDRFEAALRAAEKEIVDAVGRGTF